MEAILGGLVNQIVGLVTGSLVTVFIGGIGVFIWKQLASKFISEGGDDAGNYLGLMLWNNGLSKIKDVNLRNEMIKDLDTAGNDFDRGWSLGIRGEKI